MAWTRDTAVRRERDRHAARRVAGALWLASVYRAEGRYADAHDQLFSARLWRMYRRALP